MIKRSHLLAIGELIHMNGMRDPRQPVPTTRTNQPDQADQTVATKLTTMLDKAYEAGLWGGNGYMPEGTDADIEALWHAAQAKSEEVKKLVKRLNEFVFDMITCHGDALNPTQRSRAEVLLKESE